MTQRLSYDYILQKNVRGKSYVTVSAKGISNGLSDIPNDGADFGPDTPGTQTMGIQEALDYAANYDNASVLLNGNFYISVPIILRSTYANVAMYGINGNGYSNNGTQIFLASNFDTTTYQYMLLLQQTGNLIFSNIRLTPWLPNGTKINYTINFAVNNHDNNMIFSHATWDAAAIAQLYVSQSGNNGRYTFEDIIFNGGGQYTIYSTYPTSPWNFYHCLLGSPLYIVIPDNAGGGFTGNFINTQAVYIHSLNNNINLQNATLRFIGDGPLLYGTAQIGDNVTINVTNGRVSQYQPYNWINVQGTNFNMNIEDSYLNMNAGTSGSTYYFITASSGAFGMVRINNTYYSYYPPGVTMLPTNSSLVPVLIKNSVPSRMNWVADGLYPYSIISGTTAGTITPIYTEYSSTYIKIIYTFSGYENNTTTNQTVNHPLPFSSYAVITGNNTGLTITASTTGITITSPNNTTTYSGIVIVEGY
jgi:hypothetical protein